MLGAVAVSSRLKHRPRHTHEVLVTTTADSGEGSLRETLQNQRPGMVIRFDTAVFPVDAPASIFLEISFAGVDYWAGDDRWLGCGGDH